MKQVTIEIKFNISEKDYTTNGEFLQFKQDIINDVFDKDMKKSFEFIKDCKTTIKVK